MSRPPSSTSQPNIAVVDVDRTGAGTLHLGDGRLQHIAADQPSQIARTLLDFTAAAGRDLTVLTRHFDGRTAVHVVHPNGTVAIQRAPAALASHTDSHDGELQRLPKLRQLDAISAVAVRLRYVVTGSWRATGRWLVGHGLWLVLSAQILVLVGSLTFIVLAPYLWPNHD